MNTMRSQKLSLIFVTLCFERIISQKNPIANYEGYKVLKVIPQDQNQLTILKSLEEKHLLNVWTKNDHISKPWEIMTNPNVANITENLFNKNKIDYEVLIANLGLVPDEATIGVISNNKTRLKRFLHSRSISFDRYHRYDFIQYYLEHLVEMYPHIISVHTIGTSSRIQKILAANIFSGSANKPAILIDCGFHAREWISPAQCMYIIDQLVRNPQNSHLIHTVKWYILPLMNPDGYEYSLTVDSLWRKSLSKGVNCNGVDLNRNFDFHWHESGSSSDECNEEYAGPYAFSEPEAKALRDFTLQHRQDIKLYLSIHSYGGMIIYPWGYTNEYPHNARELQSLGEAVSKAIYDVRGTKYTVGSASNILYKSSGCSVDWMMGIAGIPLAYSIELPSRGFHPFSDENEGILKETFEGIKVFHKYINKKKRGNK